MLLFFEEPLFLFEFVKALQSLCIERVGLYGGAYGAARFGAVAAIPETTAGGQLSDVGECPIDAVARTPKLKLTHAWRIDHDSSTRQKQKLPPRGGVVAAIVACSNRLCFELLHSEQCVDER